MWRFVATIDFENVGQFWPPVQIGLNRKHYMPYMTWSGVVGGTYARLKYANVKRIFFTIEQCKNWLSVTYHFKDMDIKMLTKIAEKCQFFKSLSFQSVDPISKPSMHGVPRRSNIGINSISLEQLSTDIWMTTLWKGILKAELFK